MNGTPAAIVLVLLAAGPPLRPGPSPQQDSHAGTLVVRWTFGGRSAADVCDQMHVATVEVDLHDSSYTQAHSMTAPCAAFSATAAALPEGSYEILAVPEDSRGRPVSVPMRDRVAIEGGSSRTVTFNFPFSAVATHRRAPQP